MADVATALTNSLCANGEKAPTANLAMATFKLTGLGDGSAEQDSCTFKQLRNRIAHDDIASVVTTDNWQVDVTPATNTLTEGMIVSFRAPAAITTTTNLRLGTGSYAQIYSSDAQPIGSSGVVNNGDFMICMYSYGVWVMLNEPQVLRRTDGAGSGLDADMLDGQHGSYYAPKTSPTFLTSAFCPTVADGTNSTHLATTAYVTTKFANRLGTINGSVFLMHVNAAPTGWTRKSSWYHNYALRMNTSGNMTSGGVHVFTNCFAAGRAASVSVGATALTEAQMPSHRHYSEVYGNFVTGSAPAQGGAAFNAASTWYSGVGTWSSYTGSGATHTHTVTASTDMQAAYIDVTACTKD